MDILVIGGSGHVSGAVARAGLEAGHGVWTVTRGTRPHLPGVVPLIADRGDAERMAAVISGAGKEWDLVVDCICYDLPDIGQDLALFKGRTRQLVLVSTDFVYDPARRRFPQPEDADHWASDAGSSMAYGGKKRLCELALLEGDTGDMAPTVVRPCHIYGPTSLLGCLPLHGRDPDLLRRLRDGEPLRLVGGGHFLQQPVAADDLASTIVSVMGNSAASGRVFNVAGPDVIESREYYRIVADVLGVSLAVDEVPVAAYRAEHPESAPFLCHRIYALDRLAAAGLSVPSTPIEEGLRLHVEGLLRQGA